MQQPERSSAGAAGSCSAARGSVVEVPVSMAQWARLSAVSRGARPRRLGRDCRRRRGRCCLGEPGTDDVRHIPTEPSGRAGAHGADRRPGSRRRRCPRGTAPSRQGPQLDHRRQIGEAGASHPIGVISSQIGSRTVPSCSTSGERGETPEGRWRSCLWRVRPWWRAAVPTSQVVRFSHGRRTPAPIWTWTRRHSPASRRRLRPRSRTRLRSQGRSCCHQAPPIRSPSISPCRSMSRHSSGQRRK